MWEKINILKVSEANVESHLYPLSSISVFDMFRNYV